MPFTSIISPFESQAERLRIERRTYKKHVPLDEYGRTQTLGRRKTSHARVWIIPARTGKSQSGLTAPLEEAMGVSPASSESSSQVVTTSVIINNMSLAQFFPFPTDREKVLRPLKVGGVLGAYNCLCDCERAAVTSGQAGAIAHGLAKGLVAHEPDLSTLFRRAKLSFRDPRQVERKKTNLLKARKRRAWRRR
ncbi:ribosomal protein S9/S16-domain-containing protein [Flagelloscypha sp. PMI_526]|nr:ribosomal protein S9/S16-domain-containing protein [Flagelloscypha sp. PMI_526]